MIQEDYCSFEVAKLLKEKGFNEMTELAYGLEDGHIRNDLPVSYWRNSEIGKYKFSCQTHQMAMKWLREKDIIIVIQPEYFNAESKCSAWGCDIWSNDNYEKLQGDFPTYEEAVEAALKYALENLI